MSLPARSQREAHNIDFEYGVAKAPTAGIDTKVAPPRVGAARDRNHQEAP